MYTLLPVSKSDIAGATQQPLPGATPAAATLQHSVVSTPIEDDATPTERDPLVIVTTRSELPPQPATKESNGSASDVNDVEMALDDHVARAESEPMVTDPADTTVSNKNQTAPTRALPSIPSSTGVQVATNAQLGLKYLVEAPPKLLSKDEDVRPEWLMKTIKIFFHRFVPYFGSLGKVVDLFLTQEARLGYPPLACISFLS